MSDTQQVVLKIISNYTNHPKVGPKSKLSELRIGAIDAESIRLDLEDHFNITLGGGASIKWKKCKQIVVAVDRNLHKQTYPR